MDEEMYEVRFRVSGDADQVVEVLRQLNELEQGSVLVTVQGEPALWFGGDVSEVYRPGRELAARLSREQGWDL